MRGQGELTQDLGSDTTQEGEWLDWQRGGRLALVCLTYVPFIYLRIHKLLTLLQIIVQLMNF
jgi:hypothetical protein